VSGEWLGVGGLDSEAGHHQFTLLQVHEYHLLRSHFVIYLGRDPHKLLDAPVLMEDAPPDVTFSVGGELLILLPFGRCPFSQLFPGHHRIKLLRVHE